MTEARGLPRLEARGLPKDDPRHGWTWDDCWKDAVALLGSDESVATYIRGESLPSTKDKALDDASFRLRSKGGPKQGSLFS